MEKFKKFEGIDYANNFARKINSVHQLVEKNLPTILVDNFKVIDIGGGPGVGAKIIDKLGKKVSVLNVEPSNNIAVIPEVKWVDYSTVKLSIVDALSYSFPWKANVILLVSAAHEIALAYGKSNSENKAMFFQHLKQFIKTNACDDSFLAIGFPNYKPNVTEQEVNAQRTYTDMLLGHSHPVEEFFTLEEFSEAFAAKPMSFDQTPMVLSSESESETKLMANFAIFRINDIREQEVIK